MNVTIYPSKAKGNINITSSKSFLHRAIICASLANGTSIIKNVNMCQDVKNTINVLREIVSIKVDTDQLEINGAIDKINKKKIYIKESASTLRLLLPILLYLSEDGFELELGKGLDRRNPLLGYLRYIKTCRKLEESEKSITYFVSGFDKKEEYFISTEESSQYASGLLLLATKLNQNTRIIVDNTNNSYDYILLTINVLKLFGIDVKTESNNIFVISNQKLINTNVIAPIDGSMNLVYDIANYLGSSITISNNKSCDIITPDENLFDKLVKNNNVLDIIDVSNNPDAFVPLVSLGLKASKPISFIGVSRLETKESNRIEFVLDLLNKINAKFVNNIEEDKLTIYPFSFSGGCFSTQKDHRNAYLLTLLALSSDNPTTIADFECVFKSNPCFLDQIKALGVDVLMDTNNQELNFKMLENQTKVTFVSNTNKLNINCVFSRKSVIILDKNIPEKVTNTIISCFSNYIIYNLKKDNEDIKNFIEVENLVSFLLDNYISKNDRLVAVGGGATLDFVGFVASIYKRGIEYMSIPSTLLSQVDASIGGKTAINFGNIKNPIGSFYPPTNIYIIPPLLDYLPEAEIKNGMVELIKIAALTNSSLFYDIYDAKDYKNLSMWIFEAVKAKIEFVEKDPFDKTTRKALNFGHTFGHAIELKYNLPHGEAVAYGMMMESNNTQLKELLLKLGFDKKINKNDLVELIKNDKKQVNNTIKMVSLIEIGKYELIDKTIDELI